MVKINFKVEEIIALRKKGITLKEIGKEYGVSRQRIHQILKEPKQSALTESELFAKKFLKQKYSIVLKTTACFPDFFCVDKNDKCIFYEIKTQHTVTVYQKKMFDILVQNGFDVRILFLSSNSDSMVHKKKVIGHVARSFSIYPWSQLNKKKIVTDTSARYSFSLR